jgi:hypothetical protein
MNDFLEGTTFQRKKATSAANIRPVLPAAVMRSAPFLPGEVVFVAESVGFKSPALFVCEGLEPDAVLYKTGKQCRQSECPIMGANKRKKKTYTAFEGAAVVGVVVLDWVMEN